MNVGGLLFAYFYRKLTFFIVFFFVVKKNRRIFAPEKQMMVVHPEEHRSIAQLIKRRGFFNAQGLTINEKAAKTVP